MQNEEIEQQAAIQIAKLTALRETLEALTKQQRAECMGSVIPDQLEEEPEKFRRSAQVAVMTAIERLAMEMSLPLMDGSKVPPTVPQAPSSVGRAIYAD